MRQFSRLAAASLLSLGLIACQSQTDTPAKAQQLGPAETIAQSVADLRKGDLTAVVQAALPPAHYERVKSEWKNKTQSEPSTEQDKQEFAGMMAKLTAADAETKLYTELEPHLAKAETEMGAQLPLMVGMGRGFAAQAINESTKLSEAQKQQATQVVDAIAKWVESAKFFDRDKAKAAIAKAVATARKLELSSLEQVEKMEFEQVLAKGGALYLGLSEVLNEYGLNLDAALASVKTEVVSEQGDQAKVKVSYTLFETPLSFESEMVKREGRWYGKDALAQLDAELNKPATAATDAPAADAPAADTAAATTAQPEAAADAETSAN